MKRGWYFLIAAAVAVMACPGSVLAKPLSVAELALYKGADRQQILEEGAIASKGKGAPVDWTPLEPVHMNVGQIALAKEVRHPHAALLFADFELSKEGAEIQKSKGYAHLRKDLPSLTPPYKKYFGSDSLEESRKNQELFNRYF